MPILTSTLGLIVLAATSRGSDFTAGSKAKLDPSLNVTFNAPAKRFTESCPLGNGRLGAMVFGDPIKDVVVLNESTMWSGSPQDADRPGAVESLPEIRHLLMVGENLKAQDLLQKTFVCQGAGSGYGAGKNVPYGDYQVFGKLAIEYGTGNGTGNGTGKGTGKGTGNTA